MSSVSINERVEKIKSNENEMNSFIEEYKPFIASCTQKVTGRYMQYGQDDELSIALIAFAEAINAYDAGKGSFLQFAQSVIRRRLIDFYRKEKKHGNIIPIIELAEKDDEETEVDLTEKEAITKYDEERLSELRRLELEELKEELAKWDISFFELASASPKHKRTRKMCQKVISCIISEPDLLKTLKNKKQLPVAEIRLKTGVPRKNIERARKYIIAVVIIITGDYQYIKDYVSDMNLSLQGEV